MLSGRRAWLAESLGVTMRESRSKRARMSGVMYLSGRIEGRRRALRVLQPVRGDAAPPSTPTRPPGASEQPQPRRVLRLHPALPVDHQHDQVPEGALVLRIVGDRRREELARLEILDLSRPVLRRRADRFVVHEVGDRPRVAR